MQLCPEVTEQVLPEAGAAGVAEGVVGAAVVADEWVVRKPVEPEDCVCARAAVTRCSIRPGNHAIR